MNEYHVVIAMSHANPQIRGGLFIITIFHEAEKMSKDEVQALEKALIEKHKDKKMYPQIISWQKYDD